MFWNPSVREWQKEPYMVKEYSVTSPDGKFVATVVVVPFAKTKKSGEESTQFVPMGVRIECTSNRKTEGEFQVPGMSWFVKRKTNTVTDSMGWAFRYNWGKLVTDVNNRPVLAKPEKEKNSWGEPFPKHRLYATFGPLVAKAWETFEAFRQAARKK